MIEKDTIKLLRECDAGIKMGALRLQKGAISGIRP